MLSSRSLAPVLRGLGEIRSSSDHSQNNQDRLPYSLFDKTTTSHAVHFQKRYYSPRLKGNEIANNVIKENEGSRVRTTLAELPFKPVSEAKDRRVTTPGVQFTETKPVRLCEQVQVGKPTESSLVPTTKRLVSQNRSVKRLFSPADSAQPPQVFKVNIPRRTLTNDLFTLWAGHSSKNIRHFNQLGRPNTERKGHTDLNFSGRFSPGSPGPADSSNSNTLRGSFVRIIGLADQLQEIHPGSTKENPIFGDNVGSCPKSNVPTNREMPPNKGKNIAGPSQEKPVFKRGSKPFGHLEFCEHSSTVRSTTFPKATVVHQLVTERRPEHTIYDPHTGPNGTNVVATMSPNDFSAPLASSEPLSLDRCVRNRLGGSTRQYATERGLEPSGETITLKPKRDAGNPECIEKVQPTTSKLNSFASIRQQNCLMLPPKTGRDKVWAIDGTNLSGISLSSELSNSPELSSPTRQVQCRSRPAITRIVSPRMASAPGSHASGFYQMGDTRNRPFCVKSSPCYTPLRITRRDRQSRNFHRCLFSTVGLQTSLDISTPILDSQSSKPHESITRNVSCSSTSLGKSVLAPRSKETSYSSPVLNSESPQSYDRYEDNATSPKSTGAYNGNMEMWGWDKTLTDWTSEQLSLLHHSWRDSTKRSYRAAWRRWCHWSNKHGVYFDSPTGSDLARFLSDLHQKEGLAYNTILFHRSVVATLSNPNNQNLGSHPLVVRILKAISMQKPKSSKAPIWDIDELSSWLCNNFNSTFSLFECSRRTACLLLLCSGRRVHDLTLLSIHPDHFSLTDSQAIFWPLFGSKTDCHDYRQSGWKLLKNTDNNALDPIFWINSLISLSSERRGICNTNNLFLTVRGRPKAASRTVIANWVKSLLQEAGIKASAGSIRPAVASKSWVLNFSLDSILSRGNWRSNNTFSRFYRREVKSSREIPVVSRLFQPV